MSLRDSLYLVGGILSLAAVVAFCEIAARRKASKRDRDLWR